MNFIVKNEAFVCQYCGAKNPPAEKTCRNHCRACLCSQHVDEFFPGDRQSTCLGKMLPVQIVTSKKGAFSIIHKCENCAKEMKNKMVSDDDFQIAVQISTKYAKDNV